jgi:glycine hydroxymethyltransferase
MCKEKFAKQVNSAVFPGMQGGPHDHITAAKAVAFGEALRPDFTIYAQQIIKNAQTMAEEFIQRGYRIISGGTDNHLMVLDLNNKGLVGKEAEKILEKIGISVSRSTIPNDPNPPMNPSGVRLGTPAVTTRGMKETEMKLIVALIDQAFQNKDNELKLNSLKQEVKELCGKLTIPTK